MLDDDCWSRILTAAAFTAQDMSDFVSSDGSDTRGVSGAPRHDQVVDGLDLRMAVDGCSLAGWRRYPSKATQFFDRDQQVQASALRERLAPRLCDSNNRVAFPLPSATHLYGRRVSVVALNESCRRLATLSLINKASRAAVARFHFHPVLGAETRSESAQDVATSALLRFAGGGAHPPLPAVIANSTQTIAVHVRRKRITYTPTGGFVEHDEFAPASMLWALYQGVRVTVVAAESAAKGAPLHAVNATRMSKREQKSHNSTAAQTDYGVAPAPLQPVGGCLIRLAVEGLNVPQLTPSTASLIRQPPYESLAYVLATRPTRAGWWLLENVPQKFDKRDALVTLFRDLIKRHVESHVFVHRMMIKRGIQKACHSQGPGSRPLAIECATGLTQLDNAAVFAFECGRTSFDAPKALPVDVAARVGAMAPFRVQVEFVVGEVDAGDNNCVRNGRVAHRLLGDAFYVSSRRMKESVRCDVLRKRKASTALVVSS